MIWGSLACVAACGSGLPSPPRGAPLEASFVEVPSPPPPANVEQVPPRPREAAVWTDGSWEWTGTRWRWKDGGWFARPPRGVVYSPWTTKRPGGVRLVFAAATWRDAHGVEVEGPRLLASASLSTPAEEDAGLLSDAASGFDASTEDAP
jgi:hypothetical protein